MSKRETFHLRCHFAGLCILSAALPHGSVWAQSFSSCNSGASICASPGATVGIGTTSPNQKFLLDVNGNVQISGGNLNTAMPAFQFLNGSGAQNVKVGSLFVSNDYSTGTAPTNGAYIQGNVGVGVTNPQYTVDVAGVLASEGRNGFYSNGTNPFSFTIQNSAGGTDGKIWAPMSVNGNQLISFIANDASNVSTPYEIVTRNGAAVSSVTFPQGNVGIGTTQPQHLLHVAGTIGAEAVIVSTTGADYVFDSDYRLAPLSEVADYIKDHHHLPEIPSAAEVETKGVDLGEMQSKLLAKVEELTLHLIQEQKRNDRLEAQVQSMTEETLVTRHRLAQLVGAEKK